MKLITIDVARDHCKTDGDDDNLLELYVTAAEGEAARIANRDLFATSQEQTDALAGIPAMMAAAYTAYDAAILAADASDDDRIGTLMRAQAQNQLDKMTVRADAIVNGMIVTPEVTVAVLMITAHNYKNRQAVVAGSNIGAIEVPMSAQYILEQIRWHGPSNV